jgi:hypothetical protein
MLGVVDKAEFFLHYNKVTPVCSRIERIGTQCYVLEVNLNEATPLSVLEPV